MQRKYTYPSDDELVELFCEHGYIAEVARQIAVSRKALRQHVNRRPALSSRIKSVSYDASRKVAYPPDDEMVALIQHLGSVNAVAVHFGVQRQAIFAYCNRRPKLRARLDEVVYVGGRRKWCMPSDDELLRLMGELRLYSEVASAVNVPASALKDHLGANPKLQAQMQALDRHHVSEDERRVIRAASKRRSNQRNVDTIRQQRRRWYRENIEYARSKRRVYNKISYSRRKAARYTPEAKEYVRLILNEPCSYCGSPGKAIDHIVPVSKGGDGDWTNLASACTPCNSSKRDRSLLEFLLMQSD